MTAVDAIDLDETSRRLLRPAAASTTVDVHGEATATPAGTCPRSARAPALAAPRSRVRRPSRVERSRRLVPVAMTWPPKLGAQSVGLQCAGGFAPSRGFVTCFDI